MTKQEFFAKAVPAAIASKHPWPLYQACEAALESAWGESELAKDYNNLFGMKIGFTTRGCEVVEIPTRECINGKWLTVMATWPKFSTWTACMAAQVELLNRSLIYADAISAKTGEDYVRAVSKHWATDPERANKVLATYRCNWSLLQDAVIKARQGNPTPLGFLRQQ